MLLNDQSLLRQRAYVAGEWVQGGMKASHAVRNPANGQVVAEVPDMDERDTVAAIDAAGQALGGWREHTARDRAQLLGRWHQLVLQNEADLATLMTLEQGKPVAESLAEVRYGASFIEWFAEEAKRTYGDLIPAPTADRRLMVMKQPVGVTAAITPWNFPIAMITRKVAPALAAGCTSVVKPAEATPLSALALAELAHRAGIPAGVLNVVTTARPALVGAALTTSPLVRKLSFTGSTPIGKMLMAQCAGTVKRVSMELGGNAPFIVFDDADLDLAVQGAIASKYRNSGQTCVCANRFLVHDTVYDEFARRLARAVAALKVGPGIEPGVQIGPLINAAALQKVTALVESALRDGARVATGGQAHMLGGNFYSPTVLIDVTAGMAVARDEIFGPVAPLMRFRSTDEAVELANATEYGLAAYFYSRDLNRMWRVAERLEYGIVGVNEGLISNEMAPFGGIKQSGVGREGSKYGLDEYMETKYVCVGGVRD